MLGWKAAAMLSKASGFCSTIGMWMAEARIYRGAVKCVVEISEV